MDRLQFISDVFKFSFFTWFNGEMYCNDHTFYQKDLFTNENFLYSKVLMHADGMIMSEDKCDGVIYIKKGGNYFKRNYKGPIDMQWYGINNKQNNSQTISYALTRIGKSRHELYFHNGTVHLSAELIIPSNFRIIIGENFNFHVEKNAALTIDGEIQAAPRSIFSGDGKVGITSHLNVIYPAWWKSDGTDDSIKINKAIESAPPSATIMLNAGIYNCKDFILLKDNVTLKGEGKGKTILKQIGQNWSLVYYALITHRECNNPKKGIKKVKIKDLSIINSYGTDFDNRKKHGAIGGIYLGYAQDSVIKNVAVKEGWTGITIYGSISGNPGNRITGCETSYCIHNQDHGNPGVPRGIYAGSNHLIVEDCSDFKSYGGFYAASDYGQWKNCSSKQWQGDNGWYINSNYNTVSFCKATGGSDASDGFGSGFAINSSTGNNINNCIAKYCGNMGIRIRVLKGISDLILLKNVIHGCGIGIGVDTTSSNENDWLSDASIRENIIEFNNLQGILLSNIRSSLITRNTIRNNNQIGISLSTRGALCLSAYVINNTISDNRIYDNQKIKTQLFGFYIYSSKDTGSKIENKGNIIEHSKSKGSTFGDYFGMGDNKLILTQ